MWIIPKKLHTFPSVQVMKGSDKDLESFCQMSEKSLTRKSKTTQSSTWLRRLKKGDYIKHLFTRTLKPSHSESFVDKWTYFQEDSLVSLSLLQGLRKLLKIQDTSSLTSQKESESANLEFAFSKMSRASSVNEQETENLFSNMSSEHWNNWVTEQRQEYSQRVKSVCRTNEKESSSLAFPTPSVAGCVEGGVAKNVKLTKGGFKATRENGTEYGAKLRDAVVHMANWATPVAMNDGMYVDNSPNKNKRHSQGLATQAVQSWATPNTMDSLPSRSYESAVRQATTTRKGRTLPSNLREQVDPLMIQAYSDAKQSLDQTKSNTHGKNQEYWGTPKEQDSRACLRDRGKSNLGEQVQGMFNHKETVYRLNPNWVEQLMGLEIGLTDCDYSEME